MDWFVFGDAARRAGTFRSCRRFDNRLVCRQACSLLLAWRHTSRAEYGAFWTVAICTSARGTFDYVHAWLTDFRQDLPNIDVPVLIVQRNQDRIFPLHVTGRRLATLVRVPNSG